ncbi:ectoine/hydroxyectoine ABC transporter ATP-binding protein EhuA [Izhakiella australiensis]|uniref:Ectoine/hydroxyectoine ABC transporter ATP-binding protein EhuA n=1 Tax=Izhakiella australiensis TaxID=1926881 RepID=A0A1S8YTH3_9GAMM|nr:amino acid ABC transporter ATP-binding protein [Izhakiella australiensis]OON42136.1 ectoine/hydroxyectoine ABC transporter ATP-binding protein EhuA [Izhakiella australiensis]
MSQDSPKVAVTSLVKSFDKLPVLRDVNLEVYAGEVVVILGPSGSGKTTLLRSLNFLEQPDSGTIRVCGHGISIARGQPLSREDKQQITQLRQKTAMVFQAFNLFPHKTALENVTEGLISVRKMEKSQAIARGRALLKQVGLAEKADSYPAKLSGGQKQRVAIARGLAMEPEVIFFDEPTSALDPELRDEVLSVMRQLAGAGMTMIVVTHELRFAREVADRVIFMEGGAIVANEKPAVFFDDGASPRIKQFLNRY